jgi:hypothetical protein
MEELFELFLVEQTLQCHLKTVITKSGLKGSEKNQSDFKK